MSSEKTQMVDLLSSSKKKSWTIRNFSKDGFLIDNKLYNHSIFGKKCRLDVLILWRFADLKKESKNFLSFRSLRLFRYN